MAPGEQASGVKTPFSGHQFVLALAGIRRLVVQIKAIETDDLLSRQAGVRAAQSWRDGMSPEHLRSSIAQVRSANRPAASERRGNDLKDFEDFDLKAKAIIWP